jgi:tellurite resistance protein TerC
MSIRKALAWVSFWACLALLFNLGIFLLNPGFINEPSASEKAIKFFGGYIIELSLSVDNLFVFLMIFNSFNVPPRHQRRALNYGIIGAVVLRLVFILLGAELVDQFKWLLVVFGAMLVVSGVMMALKGEKEKDYKNSRILAHIDKVIPYTGKLEGEKFFVRRNGKLYATLLFAVVLLIETADLIFNIDSIPAIISITQDRFLMFSSNVFAILGLRSL